MMNDDTTLKSSKKHPKGLWLLVFTEVWERFSYYGMRAILVLYLTKSLIEGGLAVDKQTAMLIYGWFTGLVYFTPLIGGYIADNFLGQRKSITLGATIMMLGQLSLFAFNTHMGMYLGLFLLIIGNGLFKPNIATLVGKLYKDGDDRRDAAFSYFYMGVNIGALISPILVATISDIWFAKPVINAEGVEVMSHGYKYGFLAAAVGMFIGQIVYNSLSKKYLGTLGLMAERKKEEKANHPKTPLTKQERDRIKVIFIFVLFAIFFWAGFEQAGSSLSLYTENFIDRTIHLPFIGEWTIPTGYFQSVNPLFIILLAPLYAWFWTSKFGKKFTSPLKMGIGMVILGVGFFFMLGAVAERGGDSDDVMIKASIWWLVLTYFVHTMGELCISPVGLSVVSQLAPIRLASLLMAVWMLASFFANILGGMIASVVVQLGAGTIFLYISIFVIACGVLLILLSRSISKMMHGIN